MLHCWACFFNGLKAINREKIKAESDGDVAWKKSWNDTGL